MLQSFNQFFDFNGLGVLLFLQPGKGIILLTDIALHRFILLFKRFVIAFDFLDLFCKLLNFDHILLPILFNILQQLLNYCILPMIHFVLEGLRLLPNFSVFRFNGFQIVAHPNGRVLLCFHSNIQQFCFLFISELSQLRFSLLNLFQIAVFHDLLLDIDLHFSQFRELLLQLLPERILLGILRLELLETIVGLLEGFGNVTILLLPHINGLILLGQRIFI